MNKKEITEFEKQMWRDWDAWVLEDIEEDKIRAKRKHQIEIVITIAFIIGSIAVAFIYGRMTFLFTIPMILYLVHLARKKGN